MGLIFIFVYKLDDVGSQWVHVVIAVHDDIDTSIEKRLKDSNQHFIVIAHISRSLIIRK